VASPDGDPFPPFQAMVAELRRLQDAMAAARPPAEVSTELTALLADAADRLSPFATTEARQIWGKRSSQPGRGQSIVPAVAYDRNDASHSEGSVSFGRAYLGGNMAAHGGMIPLVFDEVLGQLAGAGGRARSRTAFLHVNYRAITPIGPTLRIAGEVTRLEGRKIFITGTLHHGEVLVADAEGLFVVLKDGQP
jgi:hypothetical protein